MLVIMKPRFIKSFVIDVYTFLIYIFLYRCRRWRVEVAVRPGPRIHRGLQKSINFFWEASMNNIKQIFMVYLSLY